MTALDILTRWLVDLLDPAGKWARVTHETMDEREPGESFCSTCPDHEACMTGYPCSLVKRVNR